MPSLDGLDRTLIGATALVCSMLISAPVQCEEDVANLEARDHLRKPFSPTPINFDYEKLAGVYPKLLCLESNCTRFVRQRPGALGRLIVAISHLGQMDWQFRLA